MVSELISVILPVYNCEQSVEAAVDSVLKQTYKDLELIIVDDASDDKTADICRKLSMEDGRISIITNQNNCGALESRIKAAQAAKEKALAEEYAKKLDAVQVTVRAKVGSGGKLFGAVTNEAISKALKEQFDMDIEKNKIVQGDPIKSFGSYTVKAKLGYEVSGNINLLVVEG